MSRRKTDMVNHPAHYNAGKIEAIDFIEQVIKEYPPEVGFSLGSVLKYIARAPHKGAMLQDSAKGLWYYQRAFNQLKEILDGQNTNRRRKGVRRKNAKTAHSSRAARRADGRSTRRNVTVDRRKGTVRRAGKKATRKTKRRR